MQKKKLSVSLHINHKNDNIDQFARNKKKELF